MHRCIHIFTNTGEQLNILQNSCKIATKHSKILQTTLLENSDKIIFWGKSEYFIEINLEIKLFENTDKALFEME